MAEIQLQVKKLYNAAIEGDVPCLLNLLQDNPHILDRYTLENEGRFAQSPLHVAVKSENLEFTTQILSRKPELAEELEQIRRWSPLHVACRKGNLEIVNALVSVNPSMCLARDIDGMNPVHVAAISGHVHVLDQIVKVVPQAARERTNASASVLHLCVKQCQTDALKFLVNVVDDAEVLNFRDGDGNTVLHLAVVSKQAEMVKFLAESKAMDKNAINASGLTAMDIHIRSKKSSNNSEIWVPLKKAKALKAKTVLKPRHKQHTWLESQRNALMVVASLISTMAFQVGINPPGGAWQDNGDKAGNSIMADVESDLYDSLLTYNTVSLISSLSVILLLISGLPCKRLFVGVLMITMWVAVTATTLTYLLSVNYLTGDVVSLWLTGNVVSPWHSTGKHRPVLYALEVTIIFWMGLMAVLLLANAIRFVSKLILAIGRLVARLCKACFGIGTRHT